MSAARRCCKLLSAAVCDVVQLHAFCQPWACCRLSEPHRTVPIQASMEDPYAWRIAVPLACSAGVERSQQSQGGERSGHSHQIAGQPACSTGPHANCCDRRQLPIHRKLDHRKVERGFQKCCRIKQAVWQMSPEARIRRQCPNTRLLDPMFGNGSGLYVGTVVLVLALRQCSGNPIIGAALHHSIYNILRHELSSHTGAHVPLQVSQP